MNGVSWQEPANATSMALVPRGAVYADIDKLADKLGNRLVTRLNKAQINHSGLEDTMLCKPGEKSSLGGECVPKNTPASQVNGKSKRKSLSDILQHRSASYGNLASSALWPHDANIDKSADKLVNKLLTRLNKAQINHSGLEDTTLCKPGETLSRGKKCVPRTD